MDIADIGTSALSGGLLGTLGTALGRITGYFEHRAELGQERERWTHELQMEELRARNAASAAQSERETALQTARFDALGESLHGDAALESGYAWVSAVRALVRPVLTPLLWALYLIVFFAVMNGMADHFIADDVEAEFIGYFISNIAFTASAATLWWFGDRARPLPRR
ncbi:MAG: hypothetical protein COW29_11465 [Rhodobacterales bacterium CG15_BIG_FIL_POST_REV_8_21_14_020_59_13]|nr:MAG: hypothetical protein COW29_11465 [Rhodobacterales bacterium CG15_BIG_FIL_POST_REV_8_21_14_020_59_13]